MSQLFTCGRIHTKSLKQKLKHDHVNAVVAAVRRIMQDELSKGACERWFLRLNAELGRKTFASSTSTEDVKTEPIPVPRAWAPSKPRLTMALLDELAIALQSAVPQASFGPQGEISKVLARRVVERLLQSKDRELLEVYGELNTDTLDDTIKLNQTLSRVAFELFVYVHARAVELQRESESFLVLELHSSDQTLVGRGMRGCGIVFCKHGRDVFARSIELVRDTLSQKS